MTIAVNSITKRFNFSVIFKELTHCFQSNSITAILGPNGSGKSTLLKVISGQMEPDKGSITYANGQVNNDEVYKNLGFVAPYIDIPEEFTFIELLNFHKKFKSAKIDNEQIMLCNGLAKFANTPVKEYSSGMKQRAKLSLNLFFNHSFILYDEPCSHLDAEGFSWFNEQLAHFHKNGVVIIGSNNPNEYVHAQQSIDIQDFK